MNSIRPAHHIVLAVCLLLTSPLLSATRDSTADHQSSPNQTRPLERIAVIGASATSGWGILLRYMDEENMLSSKTISMKEIVEEVVTVDDIEIMGKGDGMFFMSPQRAGAQQVDAARAFNPTLVFALDFLFWYGYGNRDVDGRFIPSGKAGEQARLELLEKGLEMLDTFECPVILGDFPDMSDAVGYMLAANQVPSKGTLELLNTRVKEWAASRPDMHVLGMSRLVKDMRSDEPFVVGRQQWPSGSRSRFMQNDNLHPRLDGLIVLVQESGDLLAEQLEDVDLADFDFNLIEVRNRLYETRKPEGMIARPYPGVN